MQQAAEFGMLLLTTRQQLPALTYLTNREAINAEQRASTRDAEIRHDVLDRPAKVERHHATVHGRARSRPTERQPEHCTFLKLRMIFLYWLLTTVL